jgi:cellulose synthase/poly-beta-1,6-N-acetylglucosamine synthase-like glycosyltransferase
MISNRTKYRLLEMLPGTLVWAVFAFALIASYAWPVAVVTFVILFDVFWLLRVLYFVFYMIVAWRYYQQALRRDWMGDLQREYPQWPEYHHLIFLPTYKETTEVLVQTLQKIKSANYDSSKFIIVLAGEERDRERFQTVVAALQSQFANQFEKIIVTEHPMGLPDEIPGKGSNLNWSGKQVQKIIDDARIDYKKIIVSTFDCDTLVHPEYFACLTYKFLSHPNPYRSSFQPAVLYNNNLWESPAIVRIAAFGTTYWLMSELARPERLLTFSSHSMSWQALVDIGFWEKRVVSEDSRIFIQCLLRYDGDYEVTPMYIPVSMDMAAGENYWDSLKALYKQQRRWAWGAENIPYMIWNFSRHKLMPLKTKLYYIWNVSEGMFQWAAAPVLIFLLGRLPMWLAPEAVQRNVLLQNGPFVMERLMQFSMIGIIMSASLSLLLLPPKPARTRHYNYLFMGLQWVLLPLTLIVFGSLPAIDAQTKLLFGRYLGFNVTAKVRRNNVS